MRDRDIFRIEFGADVLELPSLLVCRRLPSDSMFKYLLPHSSERSTEIRVCC